MPTLVPGAEGTIQINSVPIVVGNVFNFQQTRNIMNKSFVGQAWGNSLAGQRRASFSASGSVSKEGHAALQTAFEAVSVPVSIQIGTAAGATDAGVYTFDAVPGNFNITVNGDGEWDWSWDSQNDGTVTYTPAV